MKAINLKSLSYTFKMQTKSIYYNKVPNFVQKINSQMA